MKSTLKKIDTAIKDIYKIDHPFAVSDFILNVKGIDENLLPNGSLLIQEKADDLSLGIYFHPKVQETLSNLESIKEDDWTLNETNAFATATEEISHFIYLVYNANKGTPVTQLELEIQGEIDKFLLLFFKDQITDENGKFEKYFEAVFQNFKWHPLITIEQKERYESANAFAKSFVTGIRKQLCKKELHPEMFRELRKYYRMSPSAKIGHLHKR